MDKSGEDRGQLSTDSTASRHSWSISPGYLNHNGADLLARAGINPEPSVKEEEWQDALIRGLTRKGADANESIRGSLTSLCGLMP